MQSFFHSLRHALDGLWHAITTERNLKLFTLCITIAAILGILFGISPRDWMFLILSGAGFLAVELLNTALERLADVVDDHAKKSHGSHHYQSIRATKDVAAGAALTIGCAWALSMAIIFWPYLKALFLATR